MQFQPIIKGGWQLAGGHGPVDPARAVEDMRAFVETGITTFDCADIYTGVEELIGAFRRTHPSLAIKIHTKFVPDRDNLATVDRAYVERVIDRSRARLGVNCLDLVQFHWWNYEVPRYVETALHLVDLQRAGKIAHIGVTNLDVPHLKELLDAGVPVVANQVQYSVLDQRPENGMAEFCRAHDIKLLCYGTVAGGFLTERYLNAPEPHPPFANRSLTKYKLIIDDFGGWELFQELLRMLSRIARRHSSTTSNVASRFVLEQPAVGSIIVGATNTAHLGALVRLQSLHLNAGDHADIREILSRARGPRGDIYGLERVSNGPHASIMKYNLNKS